MKKRYRFSSLVSVLLILTMLFPASLMALDKKEEKVSKTPVITQTKETKEERIVNIVNTKDEKTISMIATADLHGRIYAYEYAVDEEDSDAGIAKIQTLVKQEKAKNPNTILMDVGDTVQDNSAELFNDLPVHPMVKVLNTMNYDIWTLGNHEFNFGRDFLDRNIKAFKGDVLACNIYKEDGNYYVKPYTIINKDGVRVAVIGLVAPHIPRWEASTPEHYKELVFKTVVPEVQKAIKELDGKYDILVGSFHLGLEGEYGDVGVAQIAEACPQLNVIFSGHAHSKYDDKVVNGVKIIEPGAYGAALATADIKVKKQENAWEVASVDVKNIETKEVKEDEGIKTEFEFVHKTSIDNANEIVGKITKDFVKGTDYITGSDKVTTMPTTQIEDTALIDLINEVQLFYAGADISSAAAFKKDMNLKAGDFKRKDVANIYKYTNTLVGVNITGENLKKYMEWSASYYNTYKAGDVTISFNPEVRSYNYDMFAGVNYEIDLSKEAGKRINKLTIKGEPVENEKVYKLAINNYRYGTLEGLKLVTTKDRYFDSYEIMQDNGRIRDLIVKYVQEQKKGTVEPECDNNWKVTGFDLNHPLKYQVYEMIKKGELEIPTSEDGRTCNVKSININDLKVEGKLK